ncbi:hypothetical protein H8D30_05870 [bacterium]|nr:hypothetical protein [bacterium]
MANGPSNPKDGEVHIWIEQTDYPRGTNQFVNLTCWDKGGWTPLWEGRHYKYRTTRSSPVLSPGSKVFSDSFSMMQVIPIAEWCVGTGRLADWPRNEEDWATCLDNPEIGAAVFTDKRLRHDLWRLAHFTPQMGD